MEQCTQVQALSRTQKPGGVSLGKGKNKQIKTWVRKYRKLPDRCVRRSHGVARREDKKKRKQTQPGEPEQSPPLRPGGRWGWRQGVGTSLASVQPRPERRRSRSRESPILHPDSDSSLFKHPLLPPLQSHPPQAKCKHPNLNSHGSLWARLLPWRALPRAAARSASILLPSCLRRRLSSAKSVSSLTSCLLYWLIGRTVS